MIIDCHGHYTTAPPALGDYRESQRAAVEADPGHVGEKGTIPISDDEIRDSLEEAQLKLQRERGTDLTLFSPRASWMGHHLGNEHTSRFWTEHCNELIRRVCDLYPENFAPVCQLPQSPGAGVDSSVDELQRCVEQMGFVGCNLNPDPSGGYWTGPPLGDRYWYPLYETMARLDVPAMIHVSQACNPHVYTTGSHYLGADTTAFQQLIMSDVLQDFPTLRFIVPHGGGAVPYHWGRYRGIVQDLKMPPLEELIGDSIFFDTCVYHQAGIDLLLRVVPPKNVLFASEMVGAVRGIDPLTDHHYDDTRRYLDAAALDDADRAAIMSGNAVRVFPAPAERVNRDAVVGPMNDAAVLASPRVEFCWFDERLLTAFIERRIDDAARLLDAELEPDWPDAHDDAFLRIRLDDLAHQGAGEPWGAHALVRRSPPRRMIGHAGFHGPPGVNALGLEGAVELGYTVFPSHRGLGYATEVATALIEMARSAHGVTQFVASVAPSNAPSLAVVNKLGFEFVREREDDSDGLEHVYLSSS